MKNYVTQKMRGIRRTVWFWSWLVVMLAMTEVSWGQVYPLYGPAGDKKPTIGEVVVSFTIVEDDNPDNDYVNFAVRLKPGFQNSNSNLLLNDEGVRSGSTTINEYNALTANGTIHSFRTYFDFAVVDNAEKLSNILKYCAYDENEVSLSGNTVTISGNIYDPGNVNDQITISAPSLTINLERDALMQFPETVITGGKTTITGGFSNDANRCNSSRFNYYRWDAPIKINEGGSLNIGSICLEKSIENNGDLIFEDTYFGSRDANAIEMEGGSLLIDGGTYNTSTGYYFLNITGNAVVEIMDGYFIATYEDVIMHQKSGTVTIHNGIFESKIVAEGGTLNVKDMQCRSTSAGIEATGNAKVSIEGGHFYSDAIATTNFNQLLAPGHSFFTCYQEIQPGLRLTEITTDERELLQVKPTSSASTTMNNCIEAAKTASVGPEGTDVKIVTKQEGEKTYSEYEIYTEKGLAWIATACNQAEYNYRYDLGLSGKEYSQISNSSRVVLMANMDMSEYDWIPFSFDGKLFDGLGHVISGLNATQVKAAFINNVGIQATVANIVIANGNFNAIETDHSQFESPSAAGLVIENEGTIVNCGVQESKITTTTQNNINDIFVGGLASINTGSIENSYVTGDVVLQINQMDRGLILSCEEFITGIGGFVGDNTNGGHKMYIGFTGPSGRIENCYHAGGVANLNVDSDMPYVYEMMQDDFAINEIERSTPGTLTNCTTSPKLESLNNNVAAHVTPEGGIAWKKWTTVEGINMGYPIHGENAVSAGKLTILSEGPGEFKGSYGEETFVADTIVSINGASELKLTATPDEGSTLLKVVSIRNNAETVIAGVDAGQAFAYTLSSVSDTLKAYFGNPDMIIEEAMTVSGHTNGQNIVIDVPETAVLDFENVVIDNAAPKTTVKANSEVIIRLSGANNLGTLLNEGTTILQSEDESASLIADIENNGIFSDETGMITTVSGLAALEIEPPSDYTIEEGETVTLSVTVYAEENSNLDFQWLRKEGNEWVEIIPTRSIEVSSTLEVREAGLYRCLITNTVDGVMTVLNAYSEVEIAPAYEPEYPDIPEEPVANEAIAEDETRVYTQEGKIIVVTPNPQEVQIVSMNGSVIATAKVAGQQAFDGMNEGTYIVRVGEDVIKIRLKL